MKLQILDASVAIKWFVPDEAGYSEALQILDEVRDSPSHFAVPELFFNEMLAVLVRLIDGDGATLQIYLDAIQDLGLERIGNGRGLLACAAKLACEHGLAGYDAVYAASAQLTNGCWLTADIRAHRKIQRLEISRAVCQR